MAKKKRPLDPLSLPARGDVYLVPSRGVVLVVDVAYHGRPYMGADEWKTTVLLDGVTTHLTWWRDSDWKWICGRGAVL